MYRPDSHTELTLNLSTGFRAPNLDDMAKVFESAPGVLVVPNPDLKPEYLYNIDVGASREFGGMLLAEATCFFSYLDNAMVRREYMYNGEATIDYQGEEMTVGFNARYLLDILQVQDGLRVRMIFKDQLSPSLLCPEKGDGFLAVVMPMRL